MAKSIIIGHNSHAKNGYKAKSSNLNFKTPFAKDIAIVFMDAAFRSSDGRSGFGFAIKLNEKFIFGGSQEGPIVPSAKEGEAKGAGISKFHLFPDALEVVQGINGQFDGSIEPILQDIKTLKCFDFYSPW